MPGRQDAQLVRRTLGIRTFAAEGAGAAGQVAGQRVHLRSLVVAGVVMIAPERRAQAVAQLRAMLQASVGRTAEGLEGLVLIE